MNKRTLATIALSFFSLAPAALAQTALLNPLRAGTNLQSFLMDILQFVIQIGAVVVVLMLVFVGFKFVMAQGSDSKLADAKQMLMWTIIGALVLLGSQVIASALQSTVKAITG